MPKLTQLKKLILRRRLIQADLAERVGVSESRLSRIVNGRVRPFDYEMLQLAKALGVQVEDLSQDLVPFAEAGVVE